MSRCPECYEIYDEGESFCELDGQRLLTESDLSGVDDESEAPGPPDSHAVQMWLTGLVGVTVGILLCGALYAAQTLWSSESSGEDHEGRAYSPRVQGPVQSMRPAPVRSPESKPDSLEDESEDAEAEAAPELPSEQSAVPEPQAVSGRLNQGPVSTGPKVKDTEKNGSKAQTIILMKDGTTVEVDAAWEDKQGVWYRRGGLVSFVESQLVKAITARAEPKSSSPDDTAP